MKGAAIEVLDGRAYPLPSRGHVDKMFISRAEILGTSVISIDEIISVEGVGVHCSSELAQQVLGIIAVKCRRVRSLISRQLDEYVEILRIFMVQTQYLPPSSLLMFNCSIVCKIDLHCLYANRYGFAPIIE